MPLRTIAKFYANHDTRSPNKMCSKTLGKIALIDDQWVAQNPDATQPSDEEFWLVDVVHETKPGSARGCFLIHPIRPIPHGELTRLPPGMYREEDHEGFRILEPEIGGIHWLLPLLHRQSLKETTYAVAIRQ